jgi:hypothetical protein
VTRLKELEGELDQVDLPFLILHGSQATLLRPMKRCFGSTFFFLVFIRGF